MHTKSILPFIIFAILRLSVLGQSHLITGCWEIKEPTSVSLPIGDDLTLSQWTFSSDEFTCRLSLQDASQQDISYRLAFRIVEEKKVSSNPVLIFKSTCDEDLILEFSIEELTKPTLKLKFIKKYSSPNVHFDKVLDFERIAGPPENME